MKPAVAQVAVIRIADEWRVVSDGHPMGGYDYRVDAEEAALQLAARVRAAGRTVELLVQDRNGDLRPLEGS
jgi:hypothetical protein